MIRQCDAGGICAHIPQCDHFCHFTNAELEPETRKVKAYPSVPDDIAPVPEAWQMIGSVVVGFVLVALMVVCLLLFFTGLWIWSLLI
jgi:hypothetical protein